MRFTIIACQVMYREINYLTASTIYPTNTIWFSQGLHNTPSVLHDRLQAEIENISKKSLIEFVDVKPDAILLGYGLCSNGVVGLETGDIPLIIPRTDDCIGIFLGSQNRYLEYFNSHNGIYWYNPGWIENSFMPSPARYKEKKQSYIDLYGEDNADYLIEEENKWIKDYKYCTYINSPVLPNEEYKNFTKECASNFGWKYDEIDSDISMLSRLINGNWNEKDFLICPPHHRVVATYDGKKINAEKI